MMIGMLGQLGRMMAGSGSGLITRNVPVLEGTQYWTFAEPQTFSSSYYMEFEFATVRSGANQILISEATDAARLNITSTTGRINFDQGTLTRSFDFSTDFHDGKKHKLLVIVDSVANEVTVSVDDGAEVDTQGMTFAAASYTDIGRRADDGTLHFQGQLFRVNINGTEYPLDSGSLHYELAEGTSIGSNVLTNSTFDADLTGWSTNWGSMVNTWDSRGAVKSTADSNGFMHLFQAEALSNNYHIVQYDVVEASFSGNAAQYNYSGDDTTSKGKPVTGSTYTFVWDNSGDNLDLRVLGSDGDFIVWDNVILQEIPSTALIANNFTADHWETWEYVADLSTLYGATNNGASAIGAAWLGPHTLPTSLGWFGIAADTIRTITDSTVRIEVAQDNNNWVGGYLVNDDYVYPGIPYLVDFDADLTGANGDTWKFQNDNVIVEGNQKLLTLTGDPNVLLIDNRTGGNVTGEYIECDFTRIQRAIEVTPSLAGTTRQVATLEGNEYWQLATPKTIGVDSELTATIATTSSLGNVTIFAGSAKGNDEFVIDITNTGVVRCFAYIGTSLSTIMVSTATVNDGKQHTIRVTTTGGSTQLFVDDVVQMTTSLGLNGSQNVGFIGQRSDNTGQFAGQIFDVNIDGDAYSLDSGSLHYELAEGTSLGSNLLTNADFEAGATDWNLGNSSAATGFYFEDGALKIDSTPAVKNKATWQTGVATPGDYYLLSIDVLSIAVSGISLHLQGSYVSTTEPGRHEGVMQATGNRFYILGGTGVIAELDNASCQALPSTALIAHNITSEHWEEYTYQTLIEHDDGIVAAAWVGPELHIDPGHDNPTDWQLSGGGSVTGSKFVTDGSNPSLRGCQPAVGGVTGGRIEPDDGTYLVSYNIEAINKDFQFYLQFSGGETPPLITTTGVKTELRTVSGGVGYVTYWMPTWGLELTLDDASVKHIIEV